MCTQHILVFVNVAASWSTGAHCGVVFLGGEQHSEPFSSDGLEKHRNSYPSAWSAYLSIWEATKHNTF